MLNFFPFLFVFFWSSAFVSGQIIVQSASPFASLSFRFLIVALGFIIFAKISNEKIFVKKINIFGNNVTSENVIRNQFEVDEGDPFNEILLNKSINNIRSLNIFKSVKKEIIDDKNSKTKIINIFRRKMENHLYNY